MEHGRLTFPFPLFPGWVNGFLHVPYQLAARRPVCAVQEIDFYPPIALRHAVQLAGPDPLNPMHHGLVLCAVPAKCLCRRHNGGIPCAEVLCPFLIPRRYQELFQLPAFKPFRVLNGGKAFLPYVPPCPCLLAHESALPVPHYLCADICQFPCRKAHAQPGSGIEACLPYGIGCRKWLYAPFLCPQYQVFPVCCLCITVLVDQA